MALSVVYTRANIGVDAPLIEVEVHLGRGLPGFHLVGLPETTVKESKDRVRSAIINSGFEFPAQRITVNLAPADLPKGGGRYDLAIAIGILVASEQIPVKSLDEFEFVGELALSGDLRTVSGVMPIAVSAKQSQRALILPAVNAEEASMIKEAKIFGACSLWQVYLHLTEKQTIEQTKYLLPETSKAFGYEENELADVKHQEVAKRALIVAAAGGHNLLMYGPPGTGKSMLAHRMVDLLPTLNEQEAVDVACIYSITGASRKDTNWFKKPFRQPHHSSSASAIVGGGANPTPGEITLAHNGVLFLDELPEFGRHVLDVLREPLETGEIHLSRARHKVCYPAKFQLVAALNPSPTGDIDDGRSNHDQILKYLSKVSGPLLDRIDIQVHVPKVRIQNDLDNSKRKGMTSKDAVSITSAAVEIQVNRQGCLNAQLSGKMMEKHCHLNDNVKAFLSLAIEKLSLSMRAYHRILRVARTIADLDGALEIEQRHLAEAIQFRSFDRLLHQLSVT
ncbi:MAG: YifB family Mg chelatase-like AAA ATPase [Pseudomonadota bacterium]